MFPLFYNWIFSRFGKYFLILGRKVGLEMATRHGEERVGLPCRKRWARFPGGGLL